jgi:hypothetical protein
MRKAAVTVVEAGTFDGGATTSMFAEGGEVGSGEVLRSIQAWWF